MAGDKDWDAEEYDRLMTAWVKKNESRWESEAAALAVDGPDDIDNDGAEGRKDDDAVEKPGKHKKREAKNKDSAFKKVAAAANDMKTGAAGNGKHGSSISTLLGSEADDMNFEDVVGGDIPTKFRYTKVGKSMVLMRNAIVKVLENLMDCIDRCRFVRTLLAWMLWIFCSWTTKN